MPEPTNGLKPPALLLLNIQGCDASALSTLLWKLPFVEEFITDASESYSIISITETWLKPHISDAQVKLQNFNVYRSDRLNRERGGCCLYVKDNLIVSNELKFDGKFCGVVCCTIESTKSVVFSVYRPGDTPHEKFQEALEFIQSCIDSVDDSWTIIITGDFNFPNICWDTLSVKSSSNGCTTCANYLLKLMVKYFLTQLISQPTRIANNGTANILDLIITNREDIFRQVDICPTYLSDHQVISTMLTKDYSGITNNSNNKETPNQTEEPLFLGSLNFSKANFANIKEELSNVDWNSIKADCPSEATEVFSQTVAQCALNMFHSRKAPTKSGSHPSEECATQ